MENLDVILLTTVVVIAFVIFIVTSVQEFSKMEDKPYKFEKASGFNRAVLFNLLSSLFDEEESPEKNREKFKNTLKRTIADMETDGVYFDKEAKESLKEKPKKSPEEGKGETD